MFLKYIQEAIEAAEAPREAISAGAISGAKFEQCMRQQAAYQPIPSRDDQGSDKGALSDMDKGAAK